MKGLSKGRYDETFASEDESKAAKGKIVIMINSHPSMSAELRPGHKATK